jgi:CDP-glucose 4,6-dehydratase
MEDLVMHGDAFRGRRVLVTGHTGFKGSWLSLWLLQLGANVSGISQPPNTNPDIFGALGLEGLIDHHLIDIRDAVALDRAVRCIEPEVVFHLAAQPLVRLSYQDPKSTWDTNVGGTVNLLEAVRRSESVRAVVVVTSDKCYDNREWIWGYREHDPMGGHDPYSASKGATELVVASYRNSFFADGRIRLASGRAGNVIGGGDWSRDRIVTDFVQSISAGRPLRIRNPQATRPWQHVLEPLSGYMQLAERLLDERGQEFASGWNFGPGDESVTTVEALARDMIVAWGSGEIILEPDAKQPHEAGLLKLDCSKAATHLGWRGKWGVKQAVKATVEWYQAHARGEDMRTLSDLQIASYSSAGGGERNCDANNTKNIKDPE